MRRICKSAFLMILCLLAVTTRADAGWISIDRLLAFMYQEYDEVENITFVHDSRADRYFGGDESRASLYLGFRGKIDYKGEGVPDMWPIMVIEAYCGKDDTPNSVSRITINVDGEVYHIDDIRANDVNVEMTPTGKRITIHTTYRVLDNLNIWEAVGQANDNVRVRLSDSQNNRCEFDLTGPQIVAIRHIVKVYRLGSEVYDLDENIGPPVEGSMSVFRETCNMVANGHFETRDKWLRVGDPKRSGFDSSIDTDYAKDHVIQIYYSGGEGGYEYAWRFRTKKIEDFVPGLKMGMTPDEVARYLNMVPYTEDGSKQVFSEQETAIIDHDEIIALYEGGKLIEIKITMVDDIGYTDRKMHEDRYAKLFTYRADAPKVDIPPYNILSGENDFWWTEVGADRFAVPKIEDIITILDFGYRQHVFSDLEMKEAERFEFKSTYGRNAVLRTFYMPDRTLQVVEYYKTGTKDVERSVVYAYKTRSRDDGILGDIRPGMSKKDAIRNMRGVYDHYQADEHALTYLNSGGGSSSQEVILKLTEDDIVKEIVVINSTASHSPAFEEADKAFIYAEFGSSPHVSPTPPADSSKQPEALPNTLPVILIACGCAAVIVIAIVVFVIIKNKSVPAQPTSSNAAAPSASPEPAASEKADASATSRPKFCRKCGAPIEPDAMFCTNCGAKIGEGR